MQSPPQRSRETCRVLAEDAELAEAVPRAQRAQAIQQCVAQVASIPAGRWHLGRAPVARGEPVRSDVGLLVLAGLLTRRVGVDGRFGAELLGAGDLLRPWQGEGDTALAPVSSWRALESCRLAVLDAQATARLMRYPQLTGALVERALRRSRNLAVNMAIVHQPRVDRRLQMLLWHLADRWGVPGPGGVTLPLRLSHSVLADLVAARRPTVSAALAELARGGELRFDGRAWTLHGRAPRELAGV